MDPIADTAAEPSGYVVEVSPGERIHFLDWGGPADTSGSGVPGILLVHGLSASAWSWTAVARRVRSVRPTVALDLRGHGLSDAPTTPYDAAALADDVVAVAEGAGLVDPLAAEPVPRPRRVVLAGHGFGGIVASWAAVALGSRCAGLVLVDGGWQDVAMETGSTPAEFLRDLAEPPEILRSWDAFLADRREWDPRSWGPDEERAARATVVEVPAGHLVPAVRPHALERSVEAMFAYRPAAVLGRLDLPIVGVVAAEDEDRAKSAALAELDAVRRGHGLDPIEVVRFPGDGHNLPRYRPAELAAIILGVAYE